MPCGPPDERGCCASGALHLCSRTGVYASAHSVRTRLPRSPETAICTLPLQLRLAGTPVEAAIVRRLFPTPEAETAAPTSRGRGGPKAPPQGIHGTTRGAIQGDGRGGVAPSPSLTGRQLTVLLEAVTASGVALGEQALQLVRPTAVCIYRTSHECLVKTSCMPTRTDGCAQASVGPARCRTTSLHASVVPESQRVVWCGKQALDRLGAAAAGGALPPGDVLRALRCAAAQGCAVSRQQLQQFMGEALKHGSWVNVGCGLGHVDSVHVASVYKDAGRGGTKL